MSDDLVGLNMPAGSADRDETEGGLIMTDAKIATSRVIHGAENETVANGAVASVGVFDCRVGHMACMDIPPEENSLIYAERRFFGLDTEVTSTTEGGVYMHANGMNSKSDRWGILGRFMTAHRSQDPLVGDQKASLSLKTGKFTILNNCKKKIRRHSLVVMTQPTPIKHDGQTKKYDRIVPIRDIPPEMDTGVEFEIHGIDCHNDSIWGSVGSGSIMENGSTWLLDGKGPTDEPSGDKWDLDNLFTPESPDFDKDTPASKTPAGKALWAMVIIWDEMMNSYMDGYSVTADEYKQYKVDGFNLETKETNDPRFVLHFLPFFLLGLGPGPKTMAFAYETELKDGGNMNKASLTDFHEELPPNTMHRCKAVKRGMQVLRNAMYDYGNANPGERKGDWRLMVGDLFPLSNIAAPFCSPPNKPNFEAWRTMHVEQGKMIIHARLARSEYDHVIGRSLYETGPREPLVVVC